MKRVNAIRPARRWRCPLVFFPFSLQITYHQLCNIVFIDWVAGTRPRRDGNTKAKRGKGTGQIIIRIQKNAKLLIKKKNPSGLTHGRTSASTRPLQIIPNRLLICPLPSMDLTKEASSSTGGSARPWNGLEVPGTWLHSSWPSWNCRYPSVCQQSTWDDPKKRDQIGPLLSFIYPFLFNKERERVCVCVCVCSQSISTKPWGGLTRLCG